MLGVKRQKLLLSRALDVSVATGSCRLSHRNRSAPDYTWARTWLHFTNQKTTDGVLNLARKAVIVVTGQLQSNDKMTLNPSKPRSRLQKSKNTCESIYCFINWKCISGTPEHISVKCESQPVTWSLRSCMAGRGGGGTLVYLMLYSFINSLIILIILITTTTIIIMIIMMTIIVII